MSGFIANGTSGAEAAIENDGFWPSVDPAVLRQNTRIDGSVSGDRLRTATINAILAVNDELAAWKAQRQVEGRANLQAVPSATIDGKSRLEQLYLRAVACAVAAEVSERYRSYDATASGHQRADDLTPSIDELRRDLRWAIRDFLGTPHMTVELI